MILTSSSKLKPRKCSEEQKKKYELKDCVNNNKNESEKIYGIIKYHFRTSDDTRMLKECKS